jgi:hypothetical protein
VLTFRCPVCKKKKKEEEERNISRKQKEEFKDLVLKYLGPFL